MNKKEKSQEEKIHKAEQKFEIIIENYWIRECLKNLSYSTGIEDFKILSQWSRSIIGSNYDLDHPDYLEYKAHYQKGDVDWLKKDETYVDVKKYKKYKKCKK